MFCNFFLIIIFNTIVVISSENDSEETKYIDLLPESEKKEFIEKIARRILEEVSSAELHKNGSVEITDSQLDTHQAYVAKLLKEESKNLRRMHERKQLHSGKNDKKGDGIKFLTTRNATTTKQPKTKNKIISEKNERENKTKDVLPTADINEKKQLDNKTEKSKTREKEINESIEATTIQQLESVISNAEEKKKETISIEIEITDKKDVDRKQIPVKVVYDEGNELIDNGTQGTVPHIKTSTLKNYEKDISNLDKRSRRFSLDTQNDTIPNLDSQQTIVGGQSLLRTKENTAEERNDKNDTETESNSEKEIKSNSTITIKPEVLREIMQEVFKLENNSQNKFLNKSDNLKTDQDNTGKNLDVQQSEENIPQNVPQELDTKQKSENEILRQKRTSSIQEKSNMSSETNANMTQNTEVTNLETENKTKNNIAVEDTLIPSESIKLIITTPATSTATVIKKAADTTKVYTSTIDSTKLQKVADITTVYTASERNLEVESPTKAILLESESRENNTNNIELSTVNGSTTEEMVKAITKFITGYPSDETNDETEATPILNVTKADSDEDSDMNIKDISNISDISTLRTSGVTKIDITTLVDNVDTTKEINIDKILRNSEAEFVTSTQITPLTTVTTETQKKEEKKQFFYEIEAPVVIKNHSAVELVEDQNKTIEIIKNIISTISKKTLRHDKPVRDKQNRLGFPGKNKGQKKEYVVFELLPGQKPFQARSIPVRKDPKNYPKLPKWKPRSLVASRKDHPSQIEHPSYAVVYNYDPKHAYYNPNNKYGPKSDEDDIISSSDDISDKWSSDAFSSKENWNLQNNYKTDQRSKPLKSSSNNIDLEYYFGTDDKDILRKKTTVECKITVGQDGQMSVNKDCPSDERIVYQNPVVPPNSDENEHPRNAVLHQKLPLSHVRQSQIIMSLLGHHGYHHFDRKKSTTTTKPITEFPSGHTTMRMPPLDFLFSRIRKEDKFLGDLDEKKAIFRSNSIDPQKNHYKVFNRYHTFVDEDSEDDNKYGVSSYSGNLKKRDINIQKDRFSKKNRFQHPLIILTGNVDRNDEDDQIKTGNFVPLDFIDKALFAESSDEKDHTKLMQKYGELYYDDADDLNDGLRDKNKYWSFDQDDSSSIKENRLKEIRDFNAAQMVSNMTMKNPSKKFRNSLLQRLEKKYNKLKQGETLKANVKSNKNKKIPKNVAGLIQKLQNIYNKRKIAKEETKAGLNKISSQKQLVADLNVLKDMIDQRDNKPLKKYDWLVTAVDIRSALTKLQNLSVTIRLTNDFVNPKDLQLLKYMLYLYNKAQSPEEEIQLSLKTNDDDENPKNMRFLVDPVYKTSKTRRTLKLISVKDSDDDVPRNMRFLDRQTNVGKGRAVSKKPWASTKGIKPKLPEFEQFLKSVESGLDELHDAIRHIAEITNYRSQRWYENLKELYLENPTRKKLLGVLLHLSFTRVLDLINDSAMFGLEENYVKFAIDNPKMVDRATEEIQYIVDLLNEIEKL